MSSKNLVFFDTNILVYQFDRTAPLKQQRAVSLIEQSILEERAVISTEVVQEFMNVALKEFDTQLPLRELDIVISNLLKPLCAHFPSLDYYERGLKLYSLNSFSFYDSLIVQAAIDLDCVTLYSEDLQDGQIIGKLNVVNPFKK